MTKFHKKPKGVEAIQYLGKNTEEIFKFLDFENHKIVEKDSTIFILSHGSVVGVNVEDWIIREDDGNFTIMKNSIFVETYEELK